MSPAHRCRRPKSPLQVCPLSLTKHPDMLPVVCRRQLDRLFFLIRFLWDSCSLCADGGREDGVQRKGTLFFVGRQKRKKARLTESCSRRCSAVAVTVVPLALLPPPSPADRQKKEDLYPKTCRKKARGVADPKKKKRSRGSNRSKGTALRACI